MISFLNGKLAELSPELLVVDVQGIGYEVYIPARLYEEFAAEYGIGDEVQIYTHLQVREDDVSLFGFPTLEERRIFRLLISVSGIGPKGALGILSGMSVEQLKFAVITDDAKLIAKAPGIGLKTAQKLILELRDKFTKDELLLGEDIGTGTEGALSQPSDTAFPQNQSAFQETVLALTALGYSHSEAVQAVRGIHADSKENLTVEQILKLALKNM